MVSRLEKLELLYKYEENRISEKSSYDYGIDICSIGLVYNRHVWTCKICDCWLCYVRKSIVNRYDYIDHYIEEGITHWKRHHPFELSVLLHKGK